MGQPGSAMDLQRLHEAAVGEPVLTSTASPSPMGVRSTSGTGCDRAAPRRRADVSLERAAERRLGLVAEAAGPLTASEDSSPSFSDVQHHYVRRGSAGFQSPLAALPTELIVALSGRDRLSGFVEESASGLMGQVRLRIGDQTLTAVITADALVELKLRRGDEALAIVKSTEVMIAREAPPPEPQRRRRRPRR